MHRRDILVSAATLAAGAAVATRPATAADHRPAMLRTRDGVQLFHRDWGEGPAVVFAASWALTSEMWAYQVAHLSERGFRCVAYDRRGHGRSDVPARGYDMDTLADDLAAVIEGLQLRDVALVGHSMGGAEVIRYLGRHGSGRVRNVALVAAAAPYLLQTPDNPYGAPQAYFDARLAEWGRDFPKWVADNRAPFFTPQTSPAMSDWLVDQLVSTPVPVAMATFRAMLRRDLRPDLERIDRPTLILHGDKDASAPLEITGRRLAAGIPGARLKVYAGAPHGLFVTHMEQVNADLEAFLRA
ncbi:MAG: Arylesterase [Phenylobacterium sp.]|nr:Arylesterase [Phenylobacterium sp.]